MFQPQRQRGRPKGSKDKTRLRKTVSLFISLTHMEERRLQKSLSALQHMGHETRPDHILQERIGENHHSYTLVKPLASVVPIINRKSLTSLFRRCKMHNASLTRMDPSLPPPRRSRHALPRRLRGYIPARRRHLHRRHLRRRHARPRALRLPVLGGHAALSLRVATTRMGAREHPPGTCRRRWRR
jgi:hypothetical protein